MLRVSLDRTAEDVPFKIVVPERYVSEIYLTSEFAYFLGCCINKFPEYMKRRKERKQKEFEEDMFEWGRRQVK